MHQAAAEGLGLEMMAACAAVQVDPRTYIPPPLWAHSTGWHPDWSKPWQGWNLPAFYGVTPNPRLPLPDPEEPAPTQDAA